MKPKSTDEFAFAAFRGEWIEHALADDGLSDGAFRLLVCLAHHFLNREHRRCWPTQDTLANRAKMRTRTVQKHLAELQVRGHLSVRRQGRDRPNHYIPAFRDPHESAGLEGHDTHKLADQETAMTRKIASEDTHNPVSKTRTDLRANSLKEPVEEPIEGGSAFKADTAVQIESSVDEVDPNVSNHDRDGAPSPRSDGAWGFSRTCLTLPPIPKSAEDADAFLVKVEAIYKLPPGIPRRLRELVEKGHLTEQKLNQILSSGEKRNERSA